MVIAIDGTSGSGKSTASKALAKNLNFAYLSSGSIYRAMALKVLQSKVDTTSTNELINLLKNKTKIEIKVENGESEIYLDGKKVTTELRTPEVTNITPIIAPIPEIREIARILQHKIAKLCKNIVIEGRDIGSTVFPDAEIKIFITADIAKRVEMRYLEYLNLNKKISKQKVKEELLLRDKQDTTRKESPLVVPKDAIMFNTTPFGKEEMVTTLTNIVKEKLNQL